MQPITFFVLIYDAILNTMYRLILYKYDEQILHKKQKIKLNYLICNFKLNNQTYKIFIKHFKFDTTIFTQLKLKNTHIKYTFPIKTSIWAIFYFILSYITNKTNYNLIIYLKFYF